MSDSAIHRHHDHKEKLHKSARKKDSKKSRHKHSESPTSRHMDDESNMKDDIERIDQKENVFNEVIHRKDGKKSRHRRERSPGSDQNRKKGDDRHREDKDSRHRRHRHRKNSNESEHQEVEEKGPDVLSTKERFADGRRQRYVESPVVDNRKGHKNVSEDNRDKNDRERSMDVRTGKRKEESDEDESRKTSGGTVADNDDESYMKAKRARLEDPLSMKTGGAYIPPARLKMMQSQIEDKASIPYQRLSWEALKKSINGLINKANTSNLVQIVRDLFKENIIRGRGLLARSIMQAQALSPTFTHVYAALVAIINTKFPQIGELILKRLIIQFRKGYRRNDKTLCLSAARFIAHLVNQKVAHEVLSLEILHVLLESPSNDSVELAIGFLKECGQLLTKVSPRGMNAVFERLRTILHEAQIDKRVQYMVEVMFAVRKDGFKDHPSVVEELDIVEEDDQITHLLALENAENPEDGLNVFKADENFVVNNEKYAELRREILGESGSDDDADADSKSGSDDDESGDSGEEEEKTTIIDQTETNLISLRRTIYLTIQSSLDFEECAHKLMKMQMKPGQEVELCCMILDCCSQQRTFEKFYGLLAQRFCMLDKKYVEPFQKMFNEQYEFIHRLETNKLRNVAKLFAHLLHTDAISWEVLKAIRLNEDDTTSSSRIFIKILFQELCEFMGLTKLNNRLKDPTLQPHFEGLFPRDNPRNTRFSINFFTSIGLGGLTDELRAHLKSMPKPAPVVETSAAAAAAGDDADSSSSSDDGSSSSDSSSDSSDSDSDSSSSSSSSSSEEEKPAPKRLSEFFREHQARETKSSSSAAVSKGNVDKAQQRLLALANYEQQQQQSSKSSSKAKHGERADSGGRHRHRQDDGDDTRKQHDEGESRRRDASRHSAGNYSDEIRANDRRKSPVKERHRERRTSNERTAGHEHRSKRRSRTRDRRR